MSDGYVDLNKNHSDGHKRIRPIEFDLDGLILRGSVYEPEGGLDEGRNYPTVVIFHGFGGNRVDASSFVVQAAVSLSQAGFVVISYDRAGHGESDGTFFDTNVSMDVNHGKQVVDRIQQLDFVDRNDMHFVGISLGAVIAAICAAQVQTQPRSLVMCSTAAVFVDEIAQGKIQGRSLASLQTLGYFDFMGMKMGPAMVQDARKLDVYELAKPFNGNALIMHGTEDFVPIAYASRYKDMWGGKAELVVKDGAGHCFMSVPDREFVMSRMVHFLLNNGDKTGGHYE